MTDRDVDRLFARWRASGDADALAAVYDATAPALLRVALHLVRHPAHAEDLLQATFLAAIENTESYTPGRPVLGWLIGILRNQAKWLMRREGRAVDAGRLPERPEPDPLDAAAAGELTELVDEAIAALPEVYRPVLRLHLAQQMAPAAIAHALDRPPGTVRTQIVRGLELLRKALPVGVAGALALATQASGLAALRTVVVEHAKTAAAAHAATAAEALIAGGGALIGGGVLMKKVVASVAVLTAIAAVLWCVPGWRDHGSPDPLPAEVVDPLAAAVPSAPVEQPAPEPPAAVREALPSSDPFGSLHVRVAWADSTPAAGVGVCIWALGRANPLAHTIEEHADARGEVAIERLEAGTVWVATDRSDGIELELAPGALAEASVTIPIGTTVEVSVVDVAGRTMPGADVVRSDYGNAGLGSVVGTTDAAGRYVLRDVGPSRHVAARATGHAPSTPVSVPDEPGATVRVACELRGAGGAVRGIVRTPDGAAATGAIVFVRPPTIPPEVDAHGMSTGQPPPFELRADCDGRFAAVGINPGVALVTARSRGTGAWSGTVTVAADAELEVQILLPRAGVVEGTVRDAAGRPLDRVMVRAGGKVGATGSRTDVDGRYRLVEVTPGDVELRAGSRELGTFTRRLHVAPGKVLQVDAVVVPPGSETVLRGRVVDETGRGLAGWTVEAEPPDRSGSWRGSARTAADGGFAISGTPPRPLRVLAIAPDRLSLPSAWIDGAEPGGTEVVLTVDRARTAPARIVARVVDADGAPVAAAELSWMHAEIGRGNMCRSSADGRAASDLLPPGRYQLAVRAEGWPWLDLGERDLAPGQTLDFGTLPLACPGFLVAKLRCIDGTAAPAHVRPQVFADASSDRPATFLHRRGDAFHSGPLAPGRYVLRAAGGGKLADSRFEFEIAAGHETEETFVVPPGAPLSFTFREPAGSDSATRIAFTLTTSSGALIKQLDLTRRADGSFYGVSSTLAPGDYAVTAAADNGLRAESAFTVPPLGAASTARVARRVLDLELR